MRERTTWNRDQIVKLANSLKKAEDPRAMNQDHLKQQPAADKYEIGGPSEFGEDVHPSGGTWKAEYSGGEVKRNEIGMPEMRGDTFKTAGQDEDEEEDDDFLEKKADVCLDLAKRMLPKNASEKSIEDQAFAFMHMADADIVATAARLASQDEDEGQQDKSQQDKEAGQVPENFKKDEDKKDEDKGQQSKEAQGQVPENFKKDDDKKDEGQQSKEAQGQQQKSDEDDKKQSQQQDEQQKKEAALNDLRKRACDALQQGNPQLAQDLVQQMAQQQQAPAQQLQMSQEQAQQQIDQMLAQAQQGQPVPQQQQLMASDGALLDQMLNESALSSTDTSMLTASAGSPMMDLQLEGASMDMTEVRLGSEDEALTALFASHDEVQHAAHAQSLQTGIPVQASVAPGMSRTASTRTVGTRPTGGVAQLGGASAPSSGSEVDKLSGLWASAPDVKSLFGS